MQLRPYQQSAIDAVYHFLRTKKGNPCIVAPTGCGKSLLIATICHDAVTKWNGRVLVLAHVKELLEQTAQTLRRIAPDLEVGVYSAGLGKRDTNKAVIVAGIQSVYKKACELDRFDLIIVDECHLLPPDGEGMYQTFFRDAKIVNPNVRLIGLTATPYRLKSGMLCGPDNLLNEVCYEIGVKELIEQGYLCPLKSKSGRHKVDCEGLHIRAGEFVAMEVDRLMNTTDNVAAAVREIVAKTKNRHSILIFGASVDHAARIKKTIEKLTLQECGLVTGDTPVVKRDRILRRFKGQLAVASQLELPLRYNNSLPLVASEDERNNVERIIEREAKCGEAARFLKYLVNVNVLTTGFDAPNIDCVVLLRPMASPGLFVQMVGRGFRLHETKTDCLVLDYGGNILRHGPVDAIRIKERNGNSGSGNAPAKGCPKCNLKLHTATMTCPDCGYEFPPPEQSQDSLENTASNEGVLSGEIVDTEYDVEEISYSIHTKRGGGEDASKTLRIDYRVGFNAYHSEWVCPEHSGWARKKFEKWWQERSNDPLPDTAEEAERYAEAGSLSVPQTIIVRKTGGERFGRIVRYALAEKPHSVSENFLHDEDHEEYDDPFGLEGLENDTVPF